MSREHVLIAGVSARAAAESAARAGFVVTAIDAFADLDQHPSVRAIELSPTFSPRRAATFSREVTCDAAAYLSNFENHPSAVRLLALDRPVWGNPPDVLQRVRDPIALFNALRRRGIAVPESRVPESPGTSARPDDRKWMMKPLASGGGHRIRLWNDGSHVPPHYYLQELIEGVPGSIVFVSAGGASVALGVSFQIVGDRTFGVDGYRYCGNILVPAGDRVFDRDDDLVSAAIDLAAAVTQDFGLVGLNGIDFVARDGIPYLVEVNPRWCASMELVERAHDLSMFAAHADACRSGELPPFDRARLRHHDQALGRAVVFARRNVLVGDTAPWLADDDIRDVPRAGTRIQAGRPVCTVFGSARTTSACLVALSERAEMVHSRMAIWPA
ncbi:MAG TPA: ATP-grasp domain-containing protein [Vicinamibacterales bacterium]|nr:ATP-grasp domain-containing protein [Vicinamibacterales bacterium]